jgi:ribosomal protein S18 acetylase RimI-like enzyme
MLEGVDIRDLSNGPADAIAAVEGVFDGPVRAAAAGRFAREPGHHLFVAFEGDVAAGFVTGVEMTHPDKGTEMFLYELGVDEAFRRRGIGSALVAALAERARAGGCSGMWVLTDADNTGALRTYRTAGAGEGEPAVMLSWTFDA